MIDRKCQINYFSSFYQKKYQFLSSIYRHSNPKEGKLFNFKSNPDVLEFRKEKEIYS